MLLLDRSSVLTKYAMSAQLNSDITDLADLKSDSKVHVVTHLSLPLPLPIPSSLPRLPRRLLEEYDLTIRQEAFFPAVANVFYTCLLATLCPPFSSALHSTLLHSSFSPANLFLLWQHFVEQCKRHGPPPYTC